MTKGIIGTSLDELFSDSKFGWLFYAVGTISLGLLGMILETQGVGKPLIFWGMALLVIPLAVLLHLAKEYFRGRLPVSSDPDVLEEKLTTWRYASRGLTMAMGGLLVLPELARLANFPQIGFFTNDFILRALLVLAILNGVAVFRTDELSKDILVWLQRLKHGERPEKEHSQMTKKHV